MTETYRRYTPEEDALIREMSKLPHHSAARMREMLRLVDILDRTEAAIATRARYLEVRAGSPIV